MKNIAVLVYELSIEYNVTVLDGIAKFFEDKKDINLIISPVSVPQTDSAEFDYQYWTATEIFKSNFIDAIIVITNSFLSYIDLETFSRYLESFAPKPVFSVSAPLNLKNKYYSTATFQEAYDSVVEHLVTKHNRKKIGFFTAALTFSPDSKNRFDAYKKSLKKFGLEYNEDWILHGDFTPGCAEQVILDKFKSKEDIQFDALLCANDYTAVGAITGLKQIGVSCPEDVCIFGFDDTEICLANSPTLSTINQSVFQNGYKTAELAYNKLINLDDSNISTANAIPIYRQSCGCVDSSVHNGAFYTNDGEFHSVDDRAQSHLNIFTQSLTSFTSIFHLINQMDSNNSFSDYLEKLKENLFFRAIHELSIVFYENPIEVKKEDSYTFVLPDKAKLFMFSNIDSKVKENFADIDGIPFNPQKELLPQKYQYHITGKFILIPIFHKELNYGYLTFYIENRNYPLFAIYAKILSNSIITCYQNSRTIIEQKKLIQQNFNLNLSSKTDELTKVLNRRGIFSYGQNLISLSVSMNKNGSVLFFDLDGLKKINDTYGHEIGDLAIKTESQVLKAAFRETDLVGRLSGDEFCVIAPGFPERKVHELRNKLILLNKSFSEKNELPFILSISVGCKEFNPEESDLQILLSQADEKLYIEKAKKHSKKKRGLFKRK